MSVGLMCSCQFLAWTIITRKGIMCSQNDWHGEVMTKKSMIPSTRLEMTKYMFVLLSKFNIWFKADGVKVYAPQRHMVWLLKMKVSLPQMIRRCLKVQRPLIQAIHNITSMKKQTKWNRWVSLMMEGFLEVTGEPSCEWREERVGHARRKRWHKHEK